MHDKAGNFIPDDSTFEQAVYLSKQIQINKLISQQQKVNVEEFKQKKIVEKNRIGRKPKPGRKGRSEWDAKEKRREERTEAQHDVNLIRFYNERFIQDKSERKYKML